jgi:hypothetical protein
MNTILPSLLGFSNGINTDFAFAVEYTEESVRLFLVNKAPYRPVIRGEEFLSAIQRGKLKTKAGTPRFTGRFFQDCFFEKDAVNDCLVVLKEFPYKEGASSTVEIFATRHEINTDSLLLTHFEKLEEEELQEQLTELVMMWENTFISRLTREGVVIQPTTKPSSNPTERTRRRFEYLVRLFRRLFDLSCKEHAIRIGIPTIKIHRDTIFGEESKLFIAFDKSGARSPQFTGLRFPASFINNANLYSILLGEGLAFDERFLRNLGVI